MPAYTSGSLTGSNLEIGIALVLQDRFSNQAREASSQIKRLHNEAKWQSLPTYNQLKVWLIQLWDGLEEL